METTNDFRFSKLSPQSSALCFIRLPTGEAVFIETHERFSVLPTREFASKTDRLFGEDTFTRKLTHPETNRKAWEKKTSNGDED
jgi:hypothetical protein